MEGNVFDVPIGSKGSQEPGDGFLVGCSGGRSFVVFGGKEPVTQVFQGDGLRFDADPVFLIDIKGLGKLVGLELLDEGFTETRLLLDSGAVFAEPTDEPTLAGLMENDGYVGTNSHRYYFQSGRLGTLTLEQGKVKQNPDELR